jgi:hypothetical protein
MTSCICDPSLSFNVTVGTIRIVSAAFKAGEVLELQFAALFLATVLLTVSLLAQDIKPRQPDLARKSAANERRVSTVTGRVFAITKGGDLKPARSAQVYLFFQRGPEISSIIATAGTTPGVHYLQKELDALEENHKSGKDVSCKSGLIAIDKAILDTFEWAKQHQLTDLIRFVDTDEEGYFTISRVRPGIYELVVRGQAGINDASWLQEIEVKPGEKLTAKVSSVESSCSTLD